LIKILENKTFVADVVGDKSSILDVRAETDIGEKINIEVQLKDLQNMEKRTLWYWGREYTKGISSGGDYKDLPKVININIVNFDNIKLEDFHTCFHLWEDEHHEYLLTDVLEIHFIIMVKFRKLKSKYKRNKPLERWLSFFDISTPEEELKEIIKMDSAISKTQERLDFVTQDKEVLREYHLREMALMDWNNGINAATENGIVQGAMQKQIEIARNLLKKGLTIDLIHETTGLDIETIQSL
jgi:predicted transposase/invertase (TIGR01784 family)